MKKERPLLQEKFFFKKIGGAQNGGRDFVNLEDLRNLNRRSGDLFPAKNQSLKKRAGAPYVRAKNEVLLPFVTQPYFWKFEVPRQFLRR